MLDDLFAYALTAVMLISVAACYLLGRSVFGGRGYAMYSKASRAATEHRLRGWTAVLAISAILSVVLVAPLLVAIWPDYLDG